MILLEVKHTYGLAAEILPKEIGKNPNYVNVSDEDFRKGMKDMGMDDWAINTNIELFELTRADYVSDISTAVEQVTASNF